LWLISGSGRAAAVRARLTGESAEARAGKAAAGQGGLGARGRGQVAGRVASPWTRVTRSGTDGVGPSRPKEDTSGATPPMRLVGLIKRLVAKDRGHGTGVRSG
jgi:hypothetical protein